MHINHNTTLLLHGLLQGEACTQLCVLSLPAGVGFANFCSFVAAFLPRIRELRVVRRESGRGSCVVLLHFKDASTTNEFYMSYNDKPVQHQPLLPCVSARHDPPGLLSLFCDDSACWRA